MYTYLCGVMNTSYILHTVFVEGHPFLSVLD